MSNHSRINEDTVAAAILSSAGALLLFGQLDIVSSRLHLSVAGSWLQWWPVLFIVSGIALMVSHRAGRSRSRKNGADSAPGEKA